MDLMLLSGCELARLIRKREVTAREIVEIHINHAVKINPSINAIVKDRFKDARLEADKADLLIKNVDSDQLPLFLGVPGTIKESLSFAGMPQSCGLVSRKSVIASQYATSVSRYINAGIIPIGVTNTSELCLWSETYNKVYGRTNNPYNVKYTAGGSSGGEAAIIASGASPLGLGSDIAGSLRFPAFFNGIFSHKPTNCLVPNTGYFPVYPGKMRRFNCIGPLARKAEDLYPLLKILSGPDDTDDLCIQQPLYDPATVDLSQLNIFSIESDNINMVSDDLRIAQQRVFKHLTSKCASCKKINIDRLKHSFEIFVHTYGKAGGLITEIPLTKGKQFNLYVEILKWVTRTSDHIFPLLGLAALEKYYATRIDKKYIKLGLELRKEIQKILGSNGILLYPTYTTIAPKHNRMLFSMKDWTYSAIFSVLKMPVTQVPLGLNSDGLPLGLQVASMPNNDHLTLAVALELEKAFGGWVPIKKNKEFVP